MNHLVRRIAQDFYSQIVVHFPYINLTSHSEKQATIIVYKLKMEKLPTSLEGFQYTMLPQIGLVSMGMLETLGGG